MGHAGWPGGTWCGAEIAPMRMGNGARAVQQPKRTRAWSGEAGTERCAGPAARTSGWLVGVVFLYLCGLSERGSLRVDDGSH
jgi:hypothetical protein